MFSLKRLFPPFYYVAIRSQLFVFPRHMFKVALWSAHSTLSANQSAVENQWNILKQVSLHSWNRRIVCLSSSLNGKSLPLSTCPTVSLKTYPRYWRMNRKLCLHLCLAVCLEQWVDFRRYWTQWLFHVVSDIIGKELYVSTKSLFYSELFCAKIWVSAL